MATKSILSVTVPAAVDFSGWVADFKDDWQISGTADDAFLLRAFSRCFRAAENYCNRRFGIETLAETIYSDRDSYPHQTPGGLSPLQLARWPLVSVVSVVQQDAGTSTTLVQFPSSDLAQNADYAVMAREGQLIRLDSFGEQMTWPAVVYVVTYQAGYLLPGQAAVSGADALPDDIEDAIGRMVWTRYAERRRDPMIAEESVVGVGSVKYLPGSGADGNLSPDIADILDNYRVPVVA